MSRFVKVVQVECNAEGRPIQSTNRAEAENIFVRYGIIDRKRKNKTFFSSRTIDNTNERLEELLAAEIIQGNKKVIEEDGDNQDSDFAEVPTNIELPEKEVDIPTNDGDPPDEEAPGLITFET